MDEPKCVEKSSREVSLTEAAGPNLFIALSGGRSQISPRIDLLIHNWSALYRGFVCFISGFLIRLLLRGFGFLALRLGKIFLPAMLKLLTTRQLPLRDNAFFAMVAFML